MAALVLVNTTARNVSPAYLSRCKISSKIASVAIAAGQAVYYVTATGRVALASAAASNALLVFLGIALKDAGIGQAVDVLEEGYTDAFEISALAFGAAVYLGDTAGTLDTAAGTVSSVVGRVEACSDRDPATSKPSKLLYVKRTLI